MPANPRRFPPFPRTPGQLAGAMLLASALLLIGAEAWARERTSHPRLAAAFERGPYSHVLIVNPPGGSPGPARVTTNRWGMRGEDPPRDWPRRETWLAIGSSTTLCPYQDDSLAWPARLQARLRSAWPGAWIGNAGIDGVTAVSLEAMLDRFAREAGPRGVILMPGGPEMSRDLSDEGRGPNAFDAACARRLARLGQPPSWRELSGLVRLYDLSRKAAAPFVHDSSGHKPWEPPPLAGPAAPLPPLDSLLPSLPAYRARLSRLGSLARALGLRAVFLTHPIAYGTDSAWARREARSVKLSGRELRISCAEERRMRDAFNAALLDACASDSLECLDLSARMSGEPRWFYDGSHFNDAGSDRAAALIAAHILAVADSALPRVTR